MPAVLLKYMPPPQSMVVLVSCPVASFSSRHFAVISGPWEPRHGRGPRYQVTALANRGTDDYILTKHEGNYSIKGCDKMYRIEEAYETYLPKNYI